MGSRTGGGRRAPRSSQKRRVVAQPRTMGAGQRAPAKRARALRPAPQPTLGSNTYCAAVVSWKPRRMAPMT